LLPAPLSFLCCHALWLRRQVISSLKLWSLSQLCVITTHRVHTFLLKTAQTSFL
jgi:hypothetical protein